LCHLHHKLIGFYNRDEKCLLRGTDWVFKGLMSCTGTTLPTLLHDMYLCTICGAR
jgi:hypothetical protein